MAIYPSATLRRFFLDLQTQLDKSTTYLDTLKADLSRQPPTRTSNEVAGELDRLFDEHFAMINRYFEDKENPLSEKEAAILRKNMARLTVTANENAKKLVTSLDDGTTPLGSEAFSEKFRELNITHSTWVDRALQDEVGLYRQLMPDQVRERV